MWLSFHIHIFIRPLFSLLFLSQWSFFLPFSCLTSICQYLFQMQSIILLVVVSMTKLYQNIFHMILDSIFALYGLCLIWLYEDVWYNQNFSFYIWNFRNDTYQEMHQPLRSQSFKHRSRPFFEVRRYPFEDISQERRKSTPNVSRRCSLTQRFHFNIDSRFLSHIYEYIE